MMRALRDWLKARSQREQRMLAVLAAIALVMLAWLAVVRPLGVALDNSQQRHARLANELQDVRALAADVKRADAVKVPRDGQSVPKIVAASAAATGLEFVSAEADAKGGVLVSIAAVRPTFLFGWIATLETAEGIIADRVSVQRNGDATVSAEVGFTRRAQ